MNLRLFVAIYPPAEIASSLSNSLGELELPEHRRVPVEQIHLTLLFLGDTTPRQLDATGESIRRASAGLGPFQLGPLRLITLPPRGRARLVAAETDAPATLLEIQRRLASRLARAPRKEGGRFRPHLTLCRFRTPSRVAPLEEPLSVPAFGVNRIVLMRSTLSPQGARHEEVASFGLAPVKT